MEPDAIKTPGTEIIVKPKVIKVGPSLELHCSPNGLVIFTPDLTISLNRVQSKEILDNLAEVY